MVIVWRLQMFKLRSTLLVGAALAALVLTAGGSSASAQSPLTTVLPDSGQGTCYDASRVVACPQAGAAFYGQDAQYAGAQPSYTANGDGTVTDNVTGLMWQQSPDTNGDGTIDAADKLSYAEALAGAELLQPGGLQRLAAADDQGAVLADPVRRHRSQRAGRQTPAWCPSSTRASSTSPTGTPPPGSAPSTPSSRPARCTWAPSTDGRPCSA